MNPSRLDRSEDDPRRSAERSRERRERARSVVSRRRRLTAVLVLAVALAAAGVAIATSQGPSGGRRASARPQNGPGTVGARRLGTGAHAPSSPPLGSLPQTHAYPSATSAQFSSQMAALWSGVANNSLSLALSAFFPEAAYVQLKAIASPSSDWRERLVHDYALDIGAAHALLGAGATGARLIRVAVSSSYGHWVPPGTCYNRVGYYEMPNARVVYSEGGQVRSFGVASMISWRGTWYVVHLGAILRSSDSGVVDEPESGPGTSVYSGVC